MLRRKWSYISKDKISSATYFWEEDVEQNTCALWGLLYKVTGLTWWLRQERICLQCRMLGFDSWVRKIPCRREWQPTPVFLPGEFCGQRSLVLQRVGHDWEANTHTHIQSYQIQKRRQSCVFSLWNLHFPARMVFSWKEKKKPGQESMYQKMG